jgi:GT2 family glycosyltransferase
MTIGVNLIVCSRIPAHRRATEVAVLSLLDSDLSDDARLVAVDNGSRDDTATWLASQGFEVIHLPENVGIVPARNAATGKLLNGECDIIVEIHNDMLFPRRWFLPLIDVLETQPDVGLASSRLITPRGTLGSPKVTVNYAKRYEILRGFVNREAVRARRPGLLRPGLQHPVAKRAAMLRQIGLYDEGFQWGNFEDTDEIKRASDAGWRYVVVGDSIVWHHYSFSRLDLDPDHGASYRANYKRFLAKWPDAQTFLRTYQAQTEAIYRD